MRIDDRNAVGGSTPARTAEVEHVQTAAGKGSGSSTRPGADSVELSGASVAVRSYNAARETQLDRVGKSVQNGSYSINPSLVSRALVAETLAGRQVA